MARQFVSRKKRKRLEAIARNRDWQSLNLVNQLAALDPNGANRQRQRIYQRLADQAKSRAYREKRRAERHPTPAVDS